MRREEHRQFAEAVDRCIERYVRGALDATVAPMAKDRRSDGVLDHAMAARHAAVWQQKPRCIGFAEQPPMLA